MKDEITLEEAIKHFEGAPEDEYHKKLAEWLKELRIYKSIGTIEEMMDKCI